MESKKILGLDIGTNSIGWALVTYNQNAEKDSDWTGEILGIGSRIFPEGVNREKGNEVSKTAARRDKRMKRRQLWRRANRKRKLARFLMQHEMFPVVERLESTLQQKNLPPELQTYFALNPYELRLKALSEPLTKVELGRVFYHLSQHRGYKEDLQNPLADGKTLRKGDAKSEKVGIDATEKLIGKGTLGQALGKIWEQGEVHTNRLRNRYTLRSMYVHEFEAIWEKQQTFHPELLNEETKMLLGDSAKGLLFSQRSLKSQKHLIGKCTFEPQKNRASNSHILFEEFSLWQFLNTIRYEEGALTLEQKKTVIEKLCYAKKDAVKFSELKKCLGLTASRFNYPDSQKLPNCPTNRHLRDIFGKSVWDKMTQKEKNHAWLIKYNAKDRIKTEQLLEEKYGFDATQQSNFIDFTLKKEYASISIKAISLILPWLQQGYMYDTAVLLAGIQKAFGKTWEKQDKENIVAKVTAIVENRKLINRDAIRHWLQTDFHFTEQQINKLYHHSEVKEVHNIGTFLTDKGGQDPYIAGIKNPIVMAALYEVRKLVSEIMAQHGKIDEIKIEMAREIKSSKQERMEIESKQRKNEERNDKIKVELDKLGKPHTNRNIQKMILFEELRKEGQTATCPYSGESFGVDDLFGNKWQIEHIIPYSISLDDSMANKTLCNYKLNHEKGQKTPFQAFGTQGKRWEEMKQRAKFLLPYRKYQRFIAEKHGELNDFISRQLNDTRYISKIAKEYLRHVCDTVRVTQGGVTSILRQHWGANNILNPAIRNLGWTDGEYWVCVNIDNQALEIKPWQYESKKGEIADEMFKRLKTKGAIKVLQGNIVKGIFHPKKQRDDHRHHAVDALVIACTETKFLQYVSEMEGKGQNMSEEERKMAFPMPWATFWKDANAAIGRILVSFKNRKRLVKMASKTVVNVKEKRFTAQSAAPRGGLHNETFYGKYPNEKTGEMNYHLRVPIESIKDHKRVAKIVDEGIKALIESELQKRGIDTNGNYTVPAEMLKTYNIDTQTTHYPLQIKGQPGPIKTVRIREKSSNMKHIAAQKGINRYAEPGNNYCIAIYQLASGKKEGEVVSFFDAVKRNIAGENVLSEKPDRELVMLLKQGDMMVMNKTETQIMNEMTKKEISQHLYVLRKISQKESTIELVFLKHNITGINVDTANAPLVMRKSPNTLIGTKVAISVTGDLFIANPNKL